MSLQTFRHCSIKADDGIIDIDNGMVVIYGPMATVYEFDADQQRFNQVDRMVDIEVKAEKNGSIVLIGDSTHLMTNIGVSHEEARFGMKITPRKGCVDCG